MLKVYSIIVTFNGERWIEQCLDSLKLSSIPSTILLIDNNSSDNTLKLVEHNYPEVIIIRLEKNIGFGKANNIGLKKALKDSADYILLINQDSWINKNTLEIIIDQFKAYSAFGIIAPVNLNSDGSKLESSFQSELKYENCPEFISDLYLLKKKGLYEIKNYINASCWILSKRCLNIVGGFDPLFSHYGEDVNYSMRARFHGFLIGVSTLTNSYHAKDNYTYNTDKLKGFLIKSKIKYINNYLLLQLTNPELKYFKRYLEELFVLVLLSLKYIYKPKYFILYLSIIYFLIIHFFSIFHNRSDSRQKDHAFI